MVVAAIVAFAAVAAVFPWPLTSYRRSEASPSSPGGTGCLCEKASCRKQTTKDCTYSTLYRALFKSPFLGKVLSLFKRPSKLANWLAAGFAENGRYT